MTIILEHFLEEVTGSLIAKQVFMDTAVGKLKVMILPKGQQLWYGISIRVDKAQKIDLECLHYIFHFVLNEKKEYVLKRGATYTALSKTATAHLRDLVQNFHEAEHSLKTRMCGNKKK